MKITKITVQAARCFNHPYESYSNLQPQVRLEADLIDGEDPIEAAKALQSQAETLVEDHKQAMLASLHHLQQMSEATAEIRRLGDEISRAQQRLTQLRNSHPNIAHELPEKISA